MTEDELKTLGALAEQAGALGAMRTLSELGLADGRAREDMAELRELLEAWRAARGRAWRALAGWLGRATGAGVLAAIAVEMGRGLVE
ncbi:MAG TPA: DUF6127 family protein [Longimicrobium sp.]|jgi:hypothetical protein